MQNRKAITMTYYNSYNDLDIKREKLYQRSVDFKNFQKIKPNEIPIIQKEAANFLERIKSNKKINVNIALENNIAVLTYLTLGNTIAKTSFDYRILFYIFTCDPNLISFKEHLKAHPNSQERKNTIRNQIGFYDERLTKYESLYFSKFLKDQELLHNIGSDIMPLFLLEANSVTTFSSISLKRFRSILKSIKEYQTNLLPTDDYKTILYHVYRQHKLLRLKTIPEQLAFFIMSTDPNFKLLTIYQEENKMDIVAQRALSEIGYFNIKLIRKEQILKREFYPNLVLTEWEKILENQEDDSISMKSLR